MRIRIARAGSGILEGIRNGLLEESDCGFQTIAEAGSLEEWIGIWEKFQNNHISNIFILNIDENRAQNTDKSTTVTEAPSPGQRRIQQLTKREREILLKISEGRLNKEIADTLHISEQTVKNHLASIFRKLKVSDRTQAAVYAVRNGICEERA